jgi:trans-aconitate methyltransferase
MDWNAQKYHDTCGRVTEHGATLVELLKNNDLKSALDLGCGTGKLTRDIASFIPDVIGADSSPAMIERAKSDYPGLDFYVADACALPWNNYFDAVFSNAVFHFIKDQDALLESIKKALKTNGLLVCEFGASGNIAALLDIIAQICVRRGKDYSLRFYYPTEEDYRSLLEKHGFSVELISTYDLDTKLIEGEAGLRNWVNQIFSIEMGWFGSDERSEVLSEIEAALRPVQWDGENWHLPNKRLRFMARKL